MDFAELTSPFHFSCLVLTCGLVLYLQEHSLSFIYNVSFSPEIDILLSFLSLLLEVYNFINFPPKEPVSGFIDFILFTYFVHFQCCSLLFFIVLVLLSLDLSCISVHFKCHWLLLFIFLASLSSDLFCIHCPHFTKQKAVLFLYNVSHISKTLTLYSVFIPNCPDSPWGRFFPTNHSSLSYVLSGTVIHMMLTFSMLDFFFIIQGNCSTCPRKSAFHPHRMVYKAGYHSCFFLPERGMQRSLLQRQTVCFCF